MTNVDNEVNTLVANRHHLCHMDKFNVCFYVLTSYGASITVELIPRTFISQTNGVGTMASKATSSYR